MTTTNTVGRLTIAVAVRGASANVSWSGVSDTRDPDERLRLHLDALIPQLAGSRFVDIDSHRWKT